MLGQYQPVKGGSVGSILSFFLLIGSFITGYLSYSEFRVNNTTRGMRCLILTVVLILVCFALDHSGMTRTLGAVMGALRTIVGIAGCIAATDPSGRERVQAFFAIILGLLLFPGGVTLNHHHHPNYDPDEAEQY